MSQQVNNTNGSSPKLSDEKEVYNSGDAPNLTYEQTRQTEFSEAGTIRADIDSGYDADFVKRTMRKVDWRLIPILSLMYMIALIDRTNLGLARSFGMQQELRLNIGTRFSAATAAFFPPYIVLEIPSQLGLRKFGARFWLASACLLWGAVQIGQGFVTTAAQLAGVRAILGAFEAALFPGAAFLISCWYPRKSMSTRMVFFYISSIVVSGLSSILAYGLAQMSGIQGKAGWRWIFIMEGVMTVAIALLGYLMIVDFPDKAKFLSEKERELVTTRIQRDRADAVPDKLTMAKFNNYLCRPTLWLYALMFMSSTLGSYSLAYFLPVILRGMGFSVVKSQLLFAPPYAWTAVPALISAYVSDKHKQRALPIVFNALCLIVGTMMYSQLPARQLAARYAGVFLAIGGCNANVPLILSWSQVNIRSHSKRAYTSALIVAFGGIGGIIAAFSFIEKEAPSYKTGVWLTFALQIFVIISALGLHFYYKMRNAKAERGEVTLEGHDDFRFQM